MAEGLRASWGQRMKGPAPTPVRQRPSLDFSLTGLLYCGIMLFMGMAAVQDQANLLFGIFGLMIGILLVSGIISRLGINRIKVRRVFPEHGVVGTTLRCVYEITNERRFWPSLSLSLAELDGVEGFARQPQCYMLHAAAGMTASVPTELIPKRRGVHEMNRYQLGTGFPFGFVKRARIDARVDHVLVYPALAQVDQRLITMCRPAEMSGSTIRPRHGGTDEFYGMKEFRVGDNPRWIYWRRSARTGALVMKQMTKVVPPRILLLVDTFVPAPTPDEAEQVERTIAMAASLASAALGQGLSVGMLAWANGWTSLSPTRGKQQRTDILSTLARLPRNTEKPLHELLRSCESYLTPGVTAVLATPQPMEMGLNESGRGGMVLLSAASPTARGWFRFDSGVDFRTCMPTDQQPVVKLDRSPRPPPTSPAKPQPAAAAAG
jgi:uncharacterized protein (DUF58 family)